MPSIGGGNDNRVVREVGRHPWEKRARPLADDDKEDRENSYSEHRRPVSRRIGEVHTHKENRHEGSGDTNAPSARESGQEHASEEEFFHGWREDNGNDGPSQARPSAGLGELRQRSVIDVGLERHDRGPT